MKTYLFKRFINFLGQINIVEPNTRLVGFKIKEAYFFFETNYQQIIHIAENIRVGVTKPDREDSMMKLSFKCDIVFKIPKENDIVDRHYNVRACYLLRKGSFIFRYRNYIFDILNNGGWDLNWLS